VPLTLTYSAEQIPMIGFFLQEVILSSIYIVETTEILRTSLQPRTRTTMKQLIVINAVIIAMDLVLLGLACASIYLLETILKGYIYSIKLKLEYAILGRLVNFVGGSQTEDTVRKQSIGFVTAYQKAETHAIDQEMDIRDFVDLSRVQTDLTHPSQARDSMKSRRKSSRFSSRLHGADLEYDFARFQHVGDIFTLDDRSETTSLCSPSPCRCRASDAVV